MDIMFIFNQQPHISSPQIKTHPHPITNLQFPYIIQIQINNKAHRNIVSRMTSTTNPLYEQSLKGTETTGNNLSHYHNSNNSNNQNGKNVTDLYKEDSVSSDPPAVYGGQGRGYGDDDLGIQGREGREIRIFMRKAEKFNEISYRKLHQGKALMPETSTINLYKSSKNILEEFNLPTQRDKQIRSIYLNPKSTRQPNKLSKNSSKKPIKYHSSLKRKLTTDSKHVQTDSINVEQAQGGYKSGKVNRTVEIGERPLPARLRKSLKAIQEDQDEEFVPVKRKTVNKMFNTISITGEIARAKVDHSAYLGNVARAEHDFNRSVRRYSKQEKEYQQNTVYGNVEHGFGKTGTFLQPIVNQASGNPWESQVVEKVEKKKGKDEEVLPVIREKSSLQEETKRTTESNKETQVSKMQKGDSRQHHNTTQNSLFVQNNGNASVRRSRISQGQFTAMRATFSNNFDSQKAQTGFKFPQKTPKPPQVAQSQTFVQVPEVHQIAIGTDTNNFILPSKKPLHPISIGFTESDTNWITSQYKPKSEFLRNIDTRNFSIKKYRNGVYFGELSEEGEKNGRGVVFYFNGRSYEGNFICDLKEGKGFQYMPDGSVYVGEFRKGLKEGKGMFQWANGEVYDGQWVGGRKNGSGMWKSPKGDTYLGEWKNGQIEGFGVLTVKEGDRYEGEFKNSMKNGLGTQRYSNGDTYVGQFAKNRPNGQGEYYYHNGDLYRGFFSNGLKHGTGYLKTSSGQIYQGQFRNEKKCGYGEETDPEGIVYKGNFENNYKHGYGEETDLNGVTIQGYWINGHQVQTQMGAIREDEMERQESIVNMKGKKQGKQVKGAAGGERENRLRKSPQRKSPLKSPKLSKSKEKELSPSDPNFHRTCGCRRKH